MGIFQCSETSFPDNLLNTSTRHTPPHTYRHSVYIHTVYPYASQLATIPLFPISWPHFSLPATTAYPPTYFTQTETLASLLSPSFLPLPPPHPFSVCITHFPILQTARPQSPQTSYLFTFSHFSHAFRRFVLYPPALSIIFLPLAPHPHTSHFPSCTADDKQCACALLKVTIVSVTI